MSLETKDESGTHKRVKGVCRWFDASKGYGFLTPDGGGDDVFVHQSEIKASGFRSLADGEQVEFDFYVDDRGRSRSMNVTGPNGAQVKGAPKPETAVATQPQQQTINPANLTPQSLMAAAVAMNAAMSSISNPYQAYFQNMYPIWAAQVAQGSSAAEYDYSQVMSMSQMQNLGFPGAATVAQQTQQQPLVKHMITQPPEPSVETGQGVMTTQVPQIPGPPRNVGGVVVRPVAQSGTFSQSPQSRGTKRGAAPPAQDVQLSSRPRVMCPPNTQGFSYDQTNVIQPQPPPQPTISYQQPPVVMGQANWVYPPPPGTATSAAVPHSVAPPQTPYQQQPLQQSMQTYPPHLAQPTTAAPTAGYGYLPQPSHVSQYGAQPQPQPQFQQMIQHPVPMAVTSTAAQTSTAARPPLPSPPPPTNLPNEQNDKKLAHPPPMPSPPPQPSPMQRSTMSYSSSHSYPTPYA